MKANYTVKEAAQILKLNEQTIRIGLQQKALPIGSAIKTSSQWTYHISGKLLEQYIGERNLHDANI